MAKYLHLDPFSVKLLSLRNASQLQLDKSTLLLEHTGTGKATDRAELTWPVDCGAFDMLPELVHILQYSSQSGHLSQMLGVPLTGWRVFSRGVESTKSRNRARRQIIQTPTPMMTLATPTYISTFATQLPSLYYAGIIPPSRLASLPVQVTESLRDKGSDWDGILATTESIPKSSEDQSTEESQFTVIPIREFSGSFQMLFSSTGLIADSSTEPLEVSAVVLSRAVLVTSATVVLLDQNQKSPSLSQFPQVKTSIHYTRSIYSALLSSTFLDTQDLSLGVSDTQHVTSVYQTILSYSKTFKITHGPPDLFSSGTQRGLSELQSPAAVNWSSVDHSLMGRASTFQISLQSKDMAAETDPIMSAMAPTVLTPFAAGTRELLQSQPAGAYEISVSVLDSILSTVWTISRSVPSMPATQLHFTDSLSISSSPALTWHAVPTVAPDSVLPLKSMTTLSVKSVVSKQEAMGMDPASHVCLQEEGLASVIAHSERIPLSRSPCSLPPITELEGSLSRSRLSGHSSATALLTDTLETITPSVRQTPRSSAELNADEMTENTLHANLLQDSETISALPSWKIYVQSSALHPYLSLSTKTYSDLIFSELSDSLTVQTKGRPCISKSAPETDTNPIGTLMSHFTPTSPPPGTLPSLQEDSVKFSHSVLDEVALPSLLMSLYETLLVFLEKPGLSQNQTGISDSEITLSTTLRLMQDSFTTGLDDIHQPATVPTPVPRTLTSEELGETLHGDFNTVLPSPQEQNLEPSISPSQHLQLTPSTTTTMPIDWFSLIETGYSASIYPSDSLGSQTETLVYTTKLDFLSTHGQLVNTHGFLIPLSSSSDTEDSQSYYFPLAEHSSLVSPDKLLTIYPTLTSVTSVPESPTIIIFTSMLSFPFLTSSESENNSSSLRSSSAGQEQQISSLSHKDTLVWPSTMVNTAMFSPELPVSAQPTTLYTSYFPILLFSPHSVNSAAPDMSHLNVFSTLLYQVEHVSPPTFSSSFYFLTIRPTLMSTSSPFLPISGATVGGKLAGSFSSAVFQSPYPTPRYTGAPNLSPSVLHPIEALVATVGFLFKYSIPSDTFSDPEDGGTDNLTLDMVPADASPLGPESWVRLDQTLRLLSGYPLDSDMQYSPLELILKARDRGGLSTQLLFTIELRRPLSQPCHSYTLSTKNSLHSFMRDRRRIEMFLDRMAKYLNDSSSSHISLSGLKSGSTVLTWHNFSLCLATTATAKSLSRCPKHKIQGVLSEMRTEAGGVNPAFQEAMLPEFRIIGVGNMTYGGVCLSPTDLDYANTTASTPQSDTYHWTVPVLITLLVMLCLFLLVVLLIAIARSCKRCDRILPSASPSLRPSDRPPCSSCHLELDILKPRKPPVFPRDIPPPPPRLWVTLAHSLQERHHGINLIHTNIKHKRPHERLGVPSHSPPRYQLPPPYVFDSVSKSPFPPRKNTDKV
ncbi:uncharacterized protein LOC136749045 [Amia ocellicauda]|uniref:uncharacterized protein LOC136749045 n=1 Tax=Amia ocellicauda TaxID=2972642 RepID=UPI00346414FD